MMRKYLLSLLLSLLLSEVNAQSWCSPGSEWHFTHFNPFNNGYMKWNYLYDTTISGKTCNKIQTYLLSVGLGGGNFTSYLYTYTSNKVVYIKDVWNAGNNFDTLFNFNATIGSKWRMAPVSQTICSVSYVSVLDTGSNFIQGQKLKWLRVNYSSPTYTANPNVNDTIYERLGALSVYPYWPENVCPQFVDGNQGGPLRCFSDNQIINFKRYANACNFYFTSLTKNHSEKNIEIYPNPSDAEFFLDFHQPGITGTVEIYNLLGSRIFQSEITGSKMEISLEHHDKGIYFLEVKTPSTNTTFKITRK